MHINWKAVGKLGLAAAKQMFPAVAAVESGVMILKNSDDAASKLDAGESLALAAIDLAEDVTDKDLLVQPKVSAAYRRFISSYVQFMNALAEAKAAKSL
jgi:hypothetical protein